jgi:hypothetical protein
MNLLRIVRQTGPNLLPRMKLKGKGANSDEVNAFGKTTNLWTITSRRVHFVRLTRGIKFFFPNLSHDEEIQCCCSPAPSDSIQPPFQITTYATFNRVRWKRLFGGSVEAPIHYLESGLSRPGLGSY